METPDPGSDGNRYGPCSVLGPVIWPEAMNTHSAGLASAHHIDRFFTDALPFPSAEPARPLPSGGMPGSHGPTLSPAARTDAQRPRPPRLAPLISRGHDKRTTASARCAPHA